MPKKTVIIFSILYVLFSLQLSAQSKMLLLNGKEKLISNYEVRGESLVYKKPHSKPGKHKKIDKFGVFAIVDSTGKEDIIYAPFDTLEDLPVEQMRLFMQGQQYARANYKASVFVKAESFAVGAASGLLAIYGTPIPFINAIIVGRPPAKFVRTGSEPEVSSTENFQYGYQYRARKKRTEQALIWGGIGFGVGIASFAILIPK